MAEALTQAELHALYTQYAFLLRRRLRLMFRNDALAEDVLHDGFVKLLQSGSGIRECATPLRWLYRVFDNLAIDRLRLTRSRGVHAPIDDVSLDEVGPAPGVDVEERDAFLKILGQLDESDAKIVVLIFVDRLTQDEAAQELGMARATVNRRLQTIKPRVAKFLAEGSHG